MADVITTEVEASENTVSAVRSDIGAAIASGTSGAVPVDRIPLNPQLVLRVNAGTTTAKIASTDRCIRVVEVPAKGGGRVQAHCSRPCIGVGDMRLCPEHDKQAFQPSQTPHGTTGRVMNSDSIPLSKGEMDELSRVSKTFSDVPAVRAPASSAPRAEVAGEPQPGLKVSFTLDELSGKNALKVILDRVCEGLDGLPCRNLREMKQMVAIQEKIAKLGGKSHERRQTVSPADSL